MSRRAMMAKQASGGGARTIPIGTSPWGWWARGGTWFQDVSRTVAATANNDPVKSWTDSSGNGRHFQNGSSSPLTKVDTGNTYLGASTIRQDGDGFKILGDPSGLTAGEIFIVRKVDADPPADTAHSGLWLFGTDGNANHYPWTDGNIYDSFGSTTRKTVGNPTPSLSSTYRVYNVYSAASDWQAFLDNTSIFATGTNTVGFLGSNACEVGNSGTGAHGYGQLVEIVMFASKLSSGDRTSMYTWLTS